MKKLLIVAMLLIISHAHALEWKDNVQISEIFSNAGIEGTFVVYDVTSKTFTGHNRIRASRQFIPASTFKIPNTLIGLSAGAVDSVDEILPYGGKPQFLKAWEKDMSLRNAIAISNVTIYKELARRIGLKPMQEGVSRMRYGNQNIGNVVDNFWLAGPLRISAVEQTLFLARLAREELPFPKAFQKKVREIIQLEQSDSRALHGKTGWVNAPEPGVGWWVGWVNRDNHLYTFALNIDIKQTADADKRIEAGKASLKALGIL